jgi:hypothetical protein
LFLKESAIDISAAENDKYEFVVKAASGQLTIDEIKAWIKSKLKD